MILRYVLRSLFIVFELGGESLEDTRITRKPYGRLHFCVCSCESPLHCMTWSVFTF